MEIVRIGVIGLGNMGQYHANYLSNGTVDGARLTAVSDAAPDRLAAYAGKAAAFTSSAELIRSGEVDAVLIATPHFSHTTIGIDALQHGLHTLVEKPISVHKADAERLLAAHTDRSLVLAAMFNQRLDERFMRVKQMVASGELGELQRVNWITTEWFRTQAYYDSSAWRATWKGEGGGLLINQCPHQLDSLQWLTGMPSRVRAFCGLGRRHNIEVEDEVTAYLEYVNGATGVLVATTGEYPGTNRLELVGDRGRIVLEGGRLQITRSPSSVSTFSRSTNEVFGKPEVTCEEVELECSPGKHEAVTQNFIDAIRLGTALVTPAEEGLHSLELANAMLYSSLTASTIELPLDGLAYEARLNELIANSTFEKRMSGTGTPVDISKSFRK
ncbi:MAG: Gfo/Idh/MocA family oxidoreductase [Chloroflexi bacterium]|nr:Gfo/Idh/MocA family oxidoreductase [Chloroflexota bacterium]